MLVFNNVLKFKRIKIKNDVLTKKKISKIFSSLFAQRFGLIGSLKLIYYSIKSNYIAGVASTAFHKADMILKNAEDVAKILIFWN